MPKLMLTTVAVLDSMVDLAKDMVDTEPIPMDLVMEVTDDSGEEFFFSK